MALAMIYPEPEKGGRGKTKERVEETSALFSAKRLSRARTVLRNAPDLAQSVLSGTQPLDSAHDIAEEKCGDLLAESTTKSPGWNQYKGRSADTTDHKTLSDLGISKDQSSQWQKLAEIPREQFEAE